MFVLTGSPFTLLERVLSRVYEIAQIVSDMNACFTERLDLRGLTVSLRSHQRSGMSHFLAGRRDGADNHRCGGFCIRAPGVPRDGVFIAASNFAEIEDCPGLGIRVQQLERLGCIESFHGIATYPDYGGLTQARRRETPRCFIRQRAA